MSRELEVNKQVEDLFSVWELDQQSKRAGLVQGDFTVTFWLDGVEQSPTFTVEEVSTTLGTYRLYWTPTVTGFWYVEVLNGINDDKHIAEYDVLDSFAYKAVGVF